MVMTTIGKRVTFKGDTSKQLGTVEDEVYLVEKYEDKDFLDLIQYIHWDKGYYGLSCYSVRVHGSGDESWKFANRPLSISPENLGRLEKR